MSAKKLISMAVALIVLTAVALMQQSGGKKHAAQAVEPTLLFQGLELNSITHVEISQGLDRVALAKSDGTWKVESLYDYPADFDKLAQALHAASEIETGRPIRSANVATSEYGFDNAKIIVLKSGDKEAIKLEVGAQREASREAGWANQHFVRKNGNDDIYLVDYDFRPFTTESDNWIDTELMNISSSDIVSVKTADAELKEDAGKWTIIGLNEETEELQTAEANKLRSALQYLNCTSVADPDKSDADLGFNNPTAYTASTTNKTITVTVGNQTDGGRYIQLSGDVPEKLTEWTYVVSNYKADNLLINRGNLVKEKEETSIQPPTTEEIK